MAFTKHLDVFLLVVACLAASPAKATECFTRRAVMILAVSADSTKATVTWLSDESCGAAHFNVAWAGGGGRIQREVPMSRTTDTWVGGRIVGTVYTVSVQMCRERFAASSKCEPWVSKRFVSCGTKGVPCGHPRLDAPEPMNIVSGVDSSGTGLCLDVRASEQTKDGGRVQIWACNGSPQQTWVYDEKVGAVISLAGKCLDVHDAQVGIDGTAVQVWDCNHQVQQRWSATSRTMVESVSMRRDHSQMAPGCRSWAATSRSNRIGRSLPHPECGFAGVALDED